MGIRALGFFRIENDTSLADSFLNEFKESLSLLGAFGFEEWKMECNSFRAEKDAFYGLSFNDAPDKNVFITPKHSVIVGDSSLKKLFKESNFMSDQKQRVHSVIFKVIHGQMAQLGDFKVRYGCILFKENISGILFDIEYLPISKLSCDFTALFTSILEMMKIKDRLQLMIPKEQENSIYTYKHLGNDYFILFQDFLPKK